MAKIINNFIKGKMSKDLDDRLVPNGEYRNAINAQVSKSEGSNVGALENALGNGLITNANFTTITGVSNLKSIGFLTDEINNSVYVFLTDNVEGSYKASGVGSNHYVFVYNTFTDTSTELISGNFLNFAQSNPITGVNILENLLFWTDNRNAPRKINVVTALEFGGTATKPYYRYDDQISVAKYNPWACMELFQPSPDSTINFAGTGHESSMQDVSSKFYPNGGSATVAGATNLGVSSFFITPTTIKGEIRDGAGGNGFTLGYILPNTTALLDTGRTVNTYSQATGQVTTSGALPAFPALTEIIISFNPYYVDNYNGDEDFLKDRFARFSYRFRFDDGEYSLFAPFTQPAFIPKQDGYFRYLQQENPPINVQDEEDTFRSTIVEFMENKVTQIGLRIPLPENQLNANNAKALRDYYRVTSVDILYKEANSLTVSVLETVQVEDIINSTGSARVKAAAVNNSVNIPIQSIQRGGPIIGAIVTGRGIVNNPTIVSYNAATEIMVLSSPQTLLGSTLLSINDEAYFNYLYQSKKPYKTLPSDELIRVYDKVPVKALSQEIISNRVVYGNFQDKHTPPNELNYNVGVSAKSNFNLNKGSGVITGGPYPAGSTAISLSNIAGTIETGSIADAPGIQSNSQVVSISGTTITLNKVTNGILNNGIVVDFTPSATTNVTTSKIEYPNHSVKMNRSYQIGFVLADRYGRQSTVILSKGDSSVQISNETFLGSTVFSPYFDQGLITQTWPGDSLKVLVNSPISPSAPDAGTGWPGVYNGDTSSPLYNPLGWYSYKIVVKQQEQEYYNVYLPGVLAAYPDNTFLELGKTSHAVLFNDNINKVPRDLQQVGPTQKQFRSSVILNARVENLNSTNAGAWNKQFYPGNTTLVVSTIAGNNDLFNADSALSYIASAQFYNVTSDPLIARISTPSKFGLQATLVTASSQAVTGLSTINLQNTGTNPPGPNTVGTIVLGMSVSGFELPEGLKVSQVTPSNGVNATSIKVSKNGTEQVVDLAVGTPLVFTPVDQNESVQRLAVLETDPETSLLDIFWETSSSGLISDLNNAVLNAGTGSSTIGDFNPNVFTEALPIGGDISSTDFKLLDNFGNTVAYADTDPPQLELASVFDFQADPQNREDDFTFQNNQDGTYNIITTKDFFFSYQNLTRDKFAFTFNINVNGVAAQSVLEASLGNLLPVIITPPGPPSSPINWTPSFGGGNAPYTLATILAQNGVGNSLNSIAKDDLTWSYTCVNSLGQDFSSNSGGNNTFVMNTSVVQNNKLQASFVYNEEPPAPNGAYTFVAKAEDAGGENSNVTATFIVNISNVTCCTYSRTLPNIPGITGQETRINCGGESQVGNIQLTGQQYSECAEASPTITYTDPNTGQTITISDFVQDCNTPCALGLG